MLHVEPDLEGPELAGELAGETGRLVVPREIEEKRQLQGLPA